MRRALLAALLALLGGKALAASQSFEVVERGRVLAAAGGCVICHTAPGGAPYAGGRALPTRFGTLVTPNLTPDRATGLGAWTDAEFQRALQEGIGRDGEHLYPVFPYPWFTRAGDDDVLAIRAFLATLAPVSNAVERNRLAFPFGLRASMAAWNTLYFDPGRFRPDASKPVSWNRGAYLVEGLGHCGACHSGRNVLGAARASRDLGGAPMQGWYAPGLDADPRTGLGAWSAAEIVEYLRTGRNARAAATGPMAEVVMQSTALLPEAELRAIAAYLKDRPAPPATTVTALPADDPRMLAGAAVYADTCAACHGDDGGGVARLYPALRDSAVVQAPEPATLLRLLLLGGQAAATDAAPTGPAMPAFHWKLDDARAAAVLTFIRNAWGNAAAPVDAASVRDARPGLLRQAAE